MKGEIKMFMMEVKPYSIIEKIMNGDSVFYYDKVEKSIKNVNDIDIESIAKMAQNSRFYFFTPYDEKEVKNDE